MYKLDCYRVFAVESCQNTGASNAKVRVRPLPGQGVPTSLYVECSRKMRNELSDTTVAILSCKVTNREGGNDFLYAHFTTPYKLVSREEAIDKIKKRELGFAED